MVRVGFLGHVGNGNLGDEAIIAAVIAELRSALPDVEIVGFTMNPEDTAQRHGVEAFALRRTWHRWNEPAPERPSFASVRQVLKRIPLVSSLLRWLRDGATVVAAVFLEVLFILRSYPLVRRLDALLVTGSGQLNDLDGGPWGYPFTLYKWTAMARWAGVPFAFMGVGAGPVDHRLGRFLLRRALRGARYRSYRDVSSAALVATLEVPGAYEVTPDLAWTVALAPGPLSRVSGDAGRVGINPLPFLADFYWGTHDEAVYRAYVAALGGLVGSLIREGRHVVLFPTQVRADPPVIATIREWMRDGEWAAEERMVEQPEVRSLDDLARTIRDVDVVVVTRFHGALLSLLLDRPGVMLSYHPKCHDLMSLVGLEPYVVEADRANAHELRRRVAELERDLPAAHERIAAALPHIQQETRAQYGRALRSVGLTK